MSCNGCRVLRKGCSESCVLRPCLQWIESAEAQGHATVFVAKFFGRAGLMSFISAVPDSQRPALFQSLLYEACGRTINPVNGAVGLLASGSWNLCQAAVEKVLKGGALCPISQIAGETERRVWPPSFSAAKRRKAPPACELGLGLTPQAPGSPSMNSEESVTTCEERFLDRRPRLLNLLL